MGRRPKDQWFEPECLNYLEVGRVVRLSRGRWLLGHVIAKEDSKVWIFFWGNEDNESEIYWTTSKRGLRIQANRTPRTFTHSKGYLCVYLGRGWPIVNRSGWQYVHKLAYLARYRTFPPRGHAIVHLNGDILDNRPSNIDSTSARVSWRERWDRLRNRE